MKEFSKFVGLDTHQDTIAVAVSEADGGTARYYGEIANTPKAMAKLVKTLTAKGAVISFCYARQEFGGHTRIKGTQYLV